MELANAKARCSDQPRKTFVLKEKMLQNIGIKMKEREAYDHLQEKRIFPLKLRQLFRRQKQGDTQDISSQNQEQSLQKSPY